MRRGSTKPKWDRSRAKHVPQEAIPLQMGAWDVKAALAKARRHREATRSRLAYAMRDTRGPTGQGARHVEQEITRSSPGQEPAKAALATARRHRAAGRYRHAYAMRDTRGPTGQGARHARQGSTKPRWARSRAKHVPQEVIRLQEGAWNAKGALATARRHRAAARCQRAYAMRDTRGPTGQSARHARRGSTKPRWARSLAKHVPQEVIRLQEGA